MFYITQLCRLCTTYKKVSLALNSVDSDNILLLDKLKTVAPQILDSDDRFPDGICRSCSVKLNDSYNFIRKCFASYETIKQYINLLQTGIKYKVNKNKQKISSKQNNKYRTLNVSVKKCKNNDKSPNKNKKNIKFVNKNQNRETEKIVLKEVVSQVQLKECYIKLNPIDHLFQTNKKDIESKTVDLANESVEDSIVINKIQAIETDKEKKTRKNLSRNKNRKSIDSNIVDEFINENSVEKNVNENEIKNSDKEINIRKNLSRNKNKTSTESNIVDKFRNENSIEKNVITEIETKNSDKEINIQKNRNKKNIKSDVDLINHVQKLVIANGIEDNDRNIVVHSRGNLFQGKSKSEIVNKDTLDGKLVINKIHEETHIINEIHEENCDNSLKNTTKDNVQLEIVDLNDKSVNESNNALIENCEATNEIQSNYDTEIISCSTLFQNENNFKTVLLNNESVNIMEENCEKINEIQSNCDTEINSRLSLFQNENNLDNVLLNNESVNIMEKSFEDTNGNQPNCESENSSLNLFQNENNFKTVPVNNEFVNMLEENYEKNNLFAPEENIFETVRIKTEINSDMDDYEEYDSELFFNSEENNILNNIKIEVDDTPDLQIFCDVEQDMQQDSRTNNLPSSSIVIRHKCIICIESFLTIEDLSLHVYYMHGRYLCILCKTIFMEYSRLEKHSCTQLPSKLQAVKSKSKVYAKSLLKKRKTYKNHPIEKQFECVICDKSFAKHFILVRHCRSKEHLENSSNSPESIEVCYRCLFCNQTFISNELLTSHCLSHTDNDRPFKCECCKKSYSNNHRLNRHYKSHSSVRPFKCTMCNKAYKYNSHLKEHIKYVHSNIRLHRCELCEHRFKRKSDLKTHIAKHFQNLSFVSE